MAKSNRRKKQDRAKAEARRAEQARLKASAERDRQRDENVAKMLDPQATSREVAQLLRTEAADSLLGGFVARGRQLSGATAQDLAEISALLQEDSPEGPGLNFLAFAMAAAHAGGDEDTENQHRAALLARAATLDGAPREGKGPGHGPDDRWIRAVREIAVLGHPGEAADLIEPYLAEHPDNEQAMTTFAAAAGKSHEAANSDHEAAKSDAASPGADRARAALARFADRSGLIATREAVLAFLDRTAWGDVVRDRVAAEVAAVPDAISRNWPAAERDAYAALAREVAFLTVGEREDEDEIAQSRNAGQRSLLAGFAADRQTPAALARRASAWDEHARFGVWQLTDPVPQPGVWVTDLTCGEPVYAEFPAEILAGAPPWTVWAGCLVPLDGVWRSTGTGLLLNPAEGDAVAQYAERAAQMILLSLAGIPNERIPAPEPISFGNAEPYGVRWDYEEPLPDGFADLAGKTVAAVLMEAAREVARHRATPPQTRNTASATEGWEKAWLDEKIPALDGLSPREAAEAGTASVMRLESLLRQFEYQAGLAKPAGGGLVDANWLRTELGLRDV